MFTKPDCSHLTSEAENNDTIFIFFLDIKTGRHSKQFLHFNSDSGPKKSENISEIIQR